MHVHIAHRWADGSETEILVGSDEDETAYPDLLSDLRSEALRVWTATCGAPVDEDTP